MIHDGVRALVGALIGMIRRARCRAVGHRFVEFSDGFKRHCPRCNKEEWVFSNPYPQIGQPKYEWKDMSWPSQK